MDKQNVNIIDILSQRQSEPNCFSQGHGGIPRSNNKHPNPEIRSELWAPNGIVNSTLVPHEIDLSTGLPKLPIELPTEDSGLLELQTMSTASGSDPARKSVTFDPSVKEGRPIPRPTKSTAIRKTMSDPSGFKDLDKPPKRGHPGSLSYKKSKSMFLQLQIPKYSPPTSMFRTSPSVLGQPETPDFYSRDHRGILDRDSSTEERDSPNILDANRSPAGCPMERRTSFLYSHILDGGDGGDGGASPNSGQGLSRSASTGVCPEETYVTPFAQILSSLHHVRAQYLELVGLPDDTKTVHTRAGWTPLAPSPSLSANRKFSDGMDKKVSLEVLNDLDWCVRQLESINSAKSVGDMAQDKFRKLLHRELSNMSVGSKRGAEVADYVSNITNLDGLDVDRALSIIYKDHDDTMESNLSDSLSHDTWTKLRAQKRERKTVVSAGGSSSTSLADNVEKNYCERIPTYGFEDERLDVNIMKEFVDKSLFDWNVDVFHFSTLACGNPLIAASYVIFKKRKFFTEFQIMPQIFINYMNTIQQLYHHDNPYHNAIHATDVLLNANHLLNTSSLDNIFTPVEQMAALVAAAIHDVDHPGFTNQYLVGVRHELAILYNDIAVLENHHLATAFKAFQNAGCDFLENFDTGRMQVFRKMVIDMVLATDMAQHIKHLAEVKTLLETKKVANDGILVLTKYSDRSAVLQCLVHCADLSNPVKNEELATKWAERIMLENFLQGDEEKKLGMVIHPLGDRTNSSIAKCQISFIDYIIFPLWETWADLVYPCGTHLVDSIHEIRDYWNNMSEPNSPPPQNKDEEESSDHTPCNTPDHTPCDAPDGLDIAAGDPEVEQNVLTSSADSATLKAQLEDSPAAERRTSFKTAKSKAVVQEISTLQGNESDII